MLSLNHSFKKVSVSHAQLAHFSTLAKENGYNRYNVSS